MILTHNNRKIKLIPREYQGIENITDYLEDFENMRLTDVERATLNKQMFRHYAELFLRKLVKAEKLDYLRIKNAFPLTTIKVLTSDNQTYYVLKMSNEFSVRCDEALYMKSPGKEEMDFNNPLFRQIAPPGAEQLRMFE